MTVAGLARAAVRQRYVVVLGLLITLFGAYLVKTAPGEYVTSAGIYLLGPRSVNNGNAYVVDDSVTMVADVVVTAVDSKQARAELAAAGVQDRYTLELFNAGDQFVPIYDRPLLQLTVRGKDPASVRRTVALVHARVDTELGLRQKEAGADPRLWVTTQLTPAAPPVVHGRGSPIRGLAAMLLLGATGTVIAVLAVDDLRRRRAGRRRAGRPVADLVG
jgi:hypothetical protein